MAEVDVVLFGRVTYGIFVATGPTPCPAPRATRSTPPAAGGNPRVIRALDERPKVVFSTTLEDADWSPTRIVAGDVAEEVRRLLAEPGRAVVGVQGSAGVVRALASADLVDEYRL